MTNPASGSVDVMVVLCDGHRCRALRARTEVGPLGVGGDLFDVLREVVRGSRGAVLVRGQCLGACHRAPLVLLLRNAGPNGGDRRGLLVGPVERPEQVAEVVDLVRQADGRPD
ncbi:(2Fe-2S) ferredoxin domain-containing protein [Plantactinospora sp. WMMC1484]|uniref:(2Fe-2S) ferredoxin domain-containing protein n=1 Tax=Plantactinospora sp. WMMC1484 TaxID=3404122 RepID=UPI003BF5CDDF